MDPPANPLPRPTPPTGASGSDGTNWKVTRELLERALDLGSEEQTAFVRREAASEEIAARVLNLLAQGDDEADTSALDEPLFGALDPDQRSRDPERLGPWELRSRIGRGGMADVWLAARADGAYRRRVAIKKLHPGLADREVVARFERERQILATLSDPGIAKMLGAGTAPDGTPYIVMELIEGQRIDEYADERHLSVRDRVQLVVKVADAVMAAHRMHVVHRDIKPSNILVDIEGRPTLLDFGVAKVLDPEKNAGSMVTVDVNRYLTPNYASPEQMRGQPLRATSDVYSLGALTYELLTGRPPLELQSLSTVEALAASETAEPIRIRDAVQNSKDPKGVARDRGVSVQRLTKILSDHDLEAVIDAALRKEPARRPPDAGAFRDELQRWLQGEPVQSRRDGALRKVWRTVRRHRVVSALSAALVLAIGVGYWSSYKEARRARSANVLLLEQSAVAESRLKDLRQSLRVVLTDSVQTLSGVRGTQHALDRILRRGISIAERQDDPGLRMRLGEALIQKSELSSRVNGPSTAAIDEAIRGLDLVEESLIALGRTGNPTSAVHFASLAARLLEVGELDRADMMAHRAIQDLSHFVPKTASERLKVQLGRGDVAGIRAQILETRGEHRAMNELAREALAELIRGGREWEAAFQSEPRAEKRQRGSDPMLDSPEYLRGQLDSIGAKLMLFGLGANQTAELVNDEETSLGPSIELVEETWDKLASSHSNNSALAGGFLVRRLDSIHLAAKSGELELARSKFEEVKNALPSVESGDADYPELIALSVAVQIRARLAASDPAAEVLGAVLRDAIDVANLLEAGLAPTFLRTEEIARLVQVAGKTAASLQQASNASAQLTRAYTLFAGLAESSPDHFPVAVGCCETALSLHELLETDSLGDTPWLDRAHAHFEALPGDSLAHASIDELAQDLWKALEKRSPVSPK